MWWYTWESLGYPTYVLHRTVGRDRHRIGMCGGTHGSPWDIPPMSYIGQWDGIDTWIGMCGGTHGSPWDIPPMSYIGQWDRIDT